MSERGSGSKRPAGLDFSVNPAALKHRINRWRELFPDGGEDRYDFSSAPPSPWAYGGEERPLEAFITDGLDDGRVDDEILSDASLPVLQQVPRRSGPRVLQHGLGGGGGGDDDGAPAEEKKAERDPSLDDVEDEKDDGPFRFNGRHFGLTYAQVGELDPEELMAFLSGLPEVQEVMVSVEKHKDGGTHFHVFGSFNKKRNIRTSRFWDFKEQHPNIKFLKGKAGVTAWRSYITKEGNFITTEAINAGTSKNFIQRSKDHEAWKDYGRRNMNKIFGATRPVPLFGVEWDSTTERRRNFWIFGPAEVGKTKAVRHFTQDWTFFNRLTAPGYYEGYNGEEFILVDDQDKDPPSKDEITHMTNGAEEKGKWPVYSRTRYTNFYLKAGVQPRFIIISQEQPALLQERWFSSRFIVLEVRERRGDGYGPEVEWDVREIQPE